MIGSERVPDLRNFRDVLESRPAIGFFLISSQGTAGDDHIYLGTVCKGICVSQRWWIVSLHRHQTKAQVISKSLLPDTAHTAR